MLAPLTARRDLDAETPVVWPAWCYSGEAGGGARRCARDAAASPAQASAQASAHAHAPTPAPPAHPQPLIKSERLSPHESTASRSRSVTPSTSSYPGTPPERGSPHAPPQPGPAHPPRNYSDIMRSLAARYNTQTELSMPRINGFGVDRTSTQVDMTDASLGGVLSRLTNSMGVSRTPAISTSLDMIATRGMYTILRATRRETSRRKRLRMSTAVEHSPLDLSAGTENAAKRARLSLSPSIRSDGDDDGQGEVRNECLCADARARVAGWSIDEVCDFVDSIDICAAYTPNFREQRIDGAGLPLLTQDHLTGILQMKLGPALKLKAVLAKRLELCAYCKAKCNKNSSPKPQLNGSSIKSEPRSNTTSPS